MIDIKRLMELSGLKEYTPTTDFIKLGRAASDALSAHQGKGRLESLESTVRYYARQHHVDYEELLATVNFYLKHPEKLMIKGLGEDDNDDETIRFSVDNEAGYNAIMDRYSDKISWDGEYMVASEEVFARIEELFASMDIDGPYEVGSEDDYDGQPSEYEEWQDYMGGDDWDHGQYDEDTYVNESEHNDENYEHNYPDDLSDEGEARASVGWGTDEEYDDVWKNRKPRASYFGGEEFQKIRQKIKDAEAALGPLGKQRLDLVLDNFPLSIDDARKILAKIKELEDEQQRQSVHYYKGLSRGDFTKPENEDIEGTNVLDLKKMYEEYQEQIAFEEFEKNLEEAVRFSGGRPPSPRKSDLERRFTRPGTTDIEKGITSKPTEPHAKTTIGNKKPWQYTNNLGSSLGLKQKIDSNNYTNVLSRDFRRWVKNSNLKVNKTRTVYDKMNNKQIKSRVWNPKGRHEDIAAFEILAGAAGNFAPGVYVRKDIATPEMIQRGRESGR